MRSKIYLDRDWLFTRCYREGMEKEIMQDGRRVTLPHSVVETPLHYFDEGIYQMVSCYQRVLSVPLDWKGQIVEITFEGAAPCGGRDRVAAQGTGLRFSEGIV